MNDESKTTIRGSEAMETAATPTPDLTWAAMTARIAEMREAEAAGRAEERTRLRAELRQAGAWSLHAEYDGYGDSGNVEAIRTEPSVPDVGAMPGLSDFLWSVAYGEHPGFENDEGGGGTVTWDLVADQVDLDHYDNLWTPPAARV